MHRSYHHATFLVSVANLNQCPPDEGLEVAFIGRSNAGKSSGLNAITQQKRLAKISKTPGRTQLINFFVCDEIRRLVDLPGYGFAKVPRGTQDAWEKLVTAYLSTRESLQGLCLFMDARHPLKPMDQNMMAWAHERQLPLHILLTKADKLRHHQQQKSLQAVQKALKPYGEGITVQLFSAQTRQGLETFQRILDGWLEIEDKSIEKNH